MDKIIYLIRAFSFLNLFEINPTIRYVLEFIHVINLRDIFMHSLILLLVGFLN